MENIKKFLGCGNYREVGKDGKFVIESFKDIYEILIPYLDKYTLLGSKSQDCLDFKEVAVLIKGKAHLTPEGLEKIQQIKSGMNKNRYNKV